MNDINYDVAVVGGGMVGTTLACALGGSGLAVAVVEPHPPGPLTLSDDVDLRVSAIYRGSERIFARLGAWTGMALRRVSPFRAMHVWDAGGSGAIRFDAREVAEPHLGHMIENRVIRGALWDRMREADNVTVIAGAGVSALSGDADAAELALADGRRVRAHVVVGADGARSIIRRLAGIAVRRWDYGQKTVVAHVRTEQSHRETAWQRFMPDGPLALLPLADGRCSIAWSTTTAYADALLDLDTARLCDAVTTASAGTLGPVVDVTPAAAYPLQFLHARRYTAERVVLIGDAAHVVHPLAGQGVNLGIFDAAALAEALLAPGSAPVDAPRRLRAYERARKGENLAMGLVLDGFYRVFGMGRVIPGLLRNAGVSLADAALPAKRAVMRRAIGVAGDLPALARPES